jgi:hypothetical protein
MANATPNRPAQIEGAGDPRALMLDVFSGEVYTTFARATVVRDTITERQISVGKTVEFPVIGRATQGYHTPGTELLGTSIPHNEVSLSVDDMNVSHVFVAEVDDLLMHYDNRAPYAEAMGEALAVNFDENAARAIILTARSGPNITGLPGGGSVIDANFNTSGTALYDGIRAAKRAMDVKNVPVNGSLYGLLPTVQWYLLAAESRLVNRDFNPGAASQTVTERDMINVDGVMVRKSNVVSGVFGQDQSAAPAVLTKYRGNFVPTAGLVYHKAATGTVIRLGATAMVERDGRRLGDLLVAKQLVGHGRLRPEAAIELRLS